MYGFNSIPTFAFGLLGTVRTDEDGGQLKPAPLAALEPDAVEQAIVKRKEQQPGWLALRKTLPE